MRKIVLASKSKARQKLLRQIGLKVTICASGTHENNKLKSNCKKLVIENALAKAKSVAKKFRTGVIIGADTVVLANNKIIGKPRTIKEAFKTLKVISRKPQWVYTGLAVVDIDRNKVFTDYERTKIYMYPLSDNQIKNYFKRISPLDKAGSFDIQGEGSIFIDRIEGCFYNVVGLPLAKLTKLLKKTGIEIF